MSKYDNFINEENLVNPLVQGEQLLWSASPKKNAYILNQALKMFPIALIWLLFDGGIIAMMFGTGEINQMLFFIIPFFLFHLMPVWIWLGNIITANKRWKNTKYYITDKRIIIQTGFVGANYQTIYYKDIKNVNLKIGFIDKLLGVGDIYFDLNSNNHSANQSFLDIENAYEIYPRLQKIVLDIQTDIEYPNALRPDENPGYNTKYNG